MSEMRISLSKRQADGNRHVVFRSPSVDDSAVRPVINQWVLPQGIAPVVRYSGEDTLYLFNIRWLERLLLTFPQATMSAGLRKRLVRAQEDALESLDDTEVDVPGFDGEFYRFQNQGINAAVEHLRQNGVFMLNDEMGLGKTIQAIATILKCKRKRVLVITKKSGCGSWAKILRTLFPRVKYEVIEGDSAQRAVKANAKVRIRLVNFEALRVKAFTSAGQPWPKDMRESKNYRKVWVADNPDIFRQHYDMIITDEFHKIKNPDAQQTQGYLQLPRAEYEMPMSGTPFLNRPLELWPVLHRLWPSKFASFWQFEQNLTIKDGNRVIAYNPDRMMELVTWVNAHSVRRRKDQIGIQMPEVITTTVMVTMTAEQRRIYNRILNEAKAELEDGTIKSVVGALPMIMRMKQACFSPELFGGTKNSAKLDELRVIVEELVANGEKAIIFTQFEQGCQILKREFADYNPAYVTGKVTGNAVRKGVKMSKREAQVEKFEHDESCKLYIGTIRANQEAISLGSATYVILMDEEWSPNANDQAIARSAAGGLRGINATVPVNVIKLQCENSVEQWIEELNDSKRAVFNRTIEGDDGREMTMVKTTLADLRGALYGRGRSKKAA